MRPLLALKDPAGQLKALLLQAPSVVMTAPPLQVGVALRSLQVEVAVHHCAEPPVAAPRQAEQEVRAEKVPQAEGEPVRPPAQGEPSSRQVEVVGHHHP